MASCRTPSTASVSAFWSARWSSASATATDVVTSIRKAEAGELVSSSRPIADARRPMAGSIPGQDLAQHEAEADRDRHRLQRVVLYEATGILHPRLRGAPREALDLVVDVPCALRHIGAGALRHLLRALLRVAAGARRHVLGVARHAPRAALRRVSDALEPSLVHGCLLLRCSARGVRLLCHRSRPPRAPALQQRRQRLRMREERGERIADALQ